jgi:hypothetical protein
MPIVMKTKILLTTLLSFIFYLLSSQVPQGFNYQAIARDADGNLINDPFYIKVDIQNLAADTVFWIEEHNVTPNEYGLISFVVGQTGRIGGTATNFSDIDWVSRPRYLKTSAKYPGPDYIVMGTTQIMSVPYSLVAKDVESPLGKLDIKGTTTKYDEAIFEVKNHDGQTIFAVYDEGVRIYVDDGAKGVKGGFAIGGFGTNKDPSQPYLIVKPDTVRIYIGTPGKATKGGFAIGGYGSDKLGPQQYLFVSGDSIRAYIDSTSVKGVKGGFAIGGFENTKAPGQEYLRVTRDSVRVYLDANPATKAVKGGFAIGGFGYTKGEDIQNYLNVTPDSTRIYINEPTSISKIPSFTVGGRNTTSSKLSDYINLGKYNSRIFTNASYSENQEFTSWNLLVNNAGSTDTIKLMKAGFASLQMTIPYGGGGKTQSGKFEVIGTVLAKRAYDKFMSIGVENILIGSGSNIRVNGLDNVIIGNNLSEGTMNLCGTGNIIMSDYFTSIGDLMCINLTDYNVLIGSEMKISGSKNICIGYNAGNNRSYDESDKLYIDVSNTSSPLIYGDFLTRTLTFNGKVGIGVNPNPGSSVLSIAELTGAATGSTLIISGNDVYFQTSKRSSKDNIEPLTDNFTKILNAQPVSFTDKRTGMHGIGYIAEDFEQAELQNLLIYENGELKSLRYDLISVYNLEIIKKQQKQIDYQKQENKQLKSQLQSLQEKVEHIESFLATSGGK